MRERIGAPLRPIDLPVYDRDRAALSTALSETAFAEAWAEGEDLSLEQAIALAISLLSDRNSS